MELIKICSVIDYRWRTHDAIAECVTDVLSTFWRQHKIYLFYIIKKHTIISRSFNITRKPAFTHFGVICNLTMLSIQNEAMQSVAVRSKELRLVQENLITPLPNLTRIAPQELFESSHKSWRKCWENQGSFCHQSRPVNRKSWMMPWILQELKKYAWKTCSCGQHWRPFDSSFELKER